MKIYDENWYRSGCETPKIDKQNEEWYYSMYDLGITLHDCFVSKIVVEQTKNGKTLHKKCILELDCSGGFTDYDTIEFDYCNIVENADICDAWILADELYKLENGKFEFHLLLEKFLKHKDVIENFTICFTSMIIKSNKENLSDIVIDKNWVGKKVHNN